MGSLRQIASVLALVAALAVTSPATAAVAGLRPPAINAGEAATLRVEVAPGQAIALPSVDGLRFEPGGQTSELRSINGAVSQHRYLLYRIIAERPGTYHFVIAGRPVELTVNDAGTAQAQTATSAPAPKEASLAFLRLAIPRRSLYVGQSVPITLKAYFRPGSEVTLAGAPDTGLGAFTISHLLEQPQQTVETIGGTPYRVAIWTAQIAAAMPGRFATGASLPIVIRYREAARRPSASFGDPFAGMDDTDDAFPSSSMLRSLMRSSFSSGLNDLFGEARQREMTLHAPSQSVEVLPLPVAGRPANFSGAVGRFEVSASVTPTNGRAFEPLSLRVEVSGHGNFDRVTMPGATATPDWKTYPATATASTTGKVFEQAIVPQRSGSLPTPSVSFTFFDPERREYVTRVTQSVALDIAPSTGAPTASAAPLMQAPAAEEPDAIRPNRFETGTRTKTLMPLYRGIGFWLATSLPLIALGLWLLARRRVGVVVSAHARRGQLRAVVAREEAKLNAAAVARDPAHFFAAAQTIVQQTLAARWQLLPEEITASEVKSRIGDGPFVAALVTAEGLRFGVVAIDVNALVGQAASIRRQLDQLEATP